MFESTVTRSIEIAATPAEVREKVIYLSFTLNLPLPHHTNSRPRLLNNFKFLQFDQIPKYHPDGFFKSIKPAIPNEPLEVGSKMHVVIELSTMEPTILVSPLLHLYRKAHGFNKRRKTPPQPSVGEAKACLVLLLATMPFALLRARSRKVQRRLLKRSSFRGRQRLLLVMVRLVR